MTPPRKSLARLRQLHRWFAPIMFLPAVLTLITGTIFQILDLQNLADPNYDWLLDWHKGHFGPINLEVIYPFLNALGLLALATTGLSLWFQTRRPKRQSSGGLD